MVNISSLIVEDDTDAVQLLQHFISRLPFFSPSDVVTSGAAALKALIKKEYQLVFLDIHLPDFNGKSLIESLPKRPEIIVTTVSPDFATDFYDLDVADYLVKPFEFPRFLRAVNRALKSTKINPGSVSDDSSIYLKVGRKVQSFAYHSIDYVEAYGIYCKIWTTTGMTVVNEPITVLIERLPDRYFVRVHKSYLIHVEKITSYDHRQIELAKVKIPIGVSYKPQLYGLLELLNKK